MPGSRPLSEGMRMAEQWQPHRGHLERTSEGTQSRDCQGEFLPSQVPAFFIRNYLEASPGLGPTVLQRNPLTGVAVLPCERAISPEGS